MPAIYHEGSWLGNATDPEVLVKDTVGWTGKNRLKNTATTQTINGVTFTVNSDGSVTANGTASANASVTIATYLTLPTDIIGQNVILTGCPEGGSTNGKYFMNAIGFRSASSGDTDTGSGVQINNVYDFTANTATKIYIEIRSGYNAQNLTFYPMLRRADITDPTYEPYHESVEEEIEQIYADNGVLGAKNFLQANATSRTVNGVTFTLNDDKSFTANGTATADIYFESHIMSAKANDVYIVSDNLANPSDSTYRGKIMGKTTGIDYAFLTTGKEKKFTVTNTEKIVYSFKVKSGQTVSNITFKPMIRLASDPDDTYVPHAMTNRELTEAMGNNVLLSWSNHYAVNDEINLSDSINNYRKLTFVMGRNSDTNGFQNIDVAIISQGIGSNTTFTRLSFYDDNATHDMIIQRISDTKLKITTSDLTSSNFGIRTIIGWK